jgi:hypothetical protein
MWILIFSFLDANEEVLFARWNTFSLVFDKNGQSALKHLINTLHHSINQIERFLVILNDAKGLGSGLKFITQPLKLKFSPCKSQQQNF